VGGGQALEDTAAAGREVEAHDAPVVLIGLAAHEASCLGTIGQLDGGVVAKQQVLCDVPDRGRQGARVAADGQQELVLLGGQAGQLGLLLAPAQELAQSGPEGQQLAVLGVIEPAVVGGHNGPSIGTGAR